MTDVRNRIKAIGQYFREMKVGTGNDGMEYIYVTVYFPHEWMIDSRTTDKFGVSVSAEDNGLTYFWSDMDGDFSSIFDAIDYNIKINLDAQEKVMLFNKKIEELQDIFSSEENTIEKLKTLTFCFDDDLKPATLPFNVDSAPKKKKKQPIKEVTEEEPVNE